MELMDEGQYKCTLILPINSPLRSTIEGPCRKTFEEAQFAVALEACQKLRDMQELDENWMPLGRENLKMPKINALVTPTVPSNSAIEPSATPDGNSETNTKPNNEPVVTKEVSHINVPGRAGTTKRRQYYFKRMAKCLSDSGKDADSFHLYALRMRLTCPIPEEQNTRGRKIHPPEDAHHCFGILVQSKMPPICEFPIYTRDGEIFVETVLIEPNLILGEEDKQRVIKFHKYTFSQVLRLEKFPMLFKADGEEVNSSVIVVPLSNSNGRVIDWDFLTAIDYEKCVKLETMSEEDRLNHPILEEDFQDAVVTPWYRNQDQPQYFYVAEICKHLSPNSDFPGQGFDTFEKYYKDKYKINIQHLNQPLLDVDHTSARLNFLTPRYVNRKGIALPTSSEETKRNKRENLEQKQILVPELCTVHPFPASLWRQAVCLPCVLYRLNSLLIADSLRRLVASEMSLGVTDLPLDYKWPSLTFGWTLADVVHVANPSKPQALQELKEIGKSTTNTKEAEQEAETAKDRSVSPLLVDGNEELGDLSTKLLDKLNKEELKLRQKSNLEIGTWSNDMAQFENDAKNQNGHEGLEEEFEDMLDPNIALPDNLMFIDDSVLPQINPEGNRRDWGTGIAQKKFRVGSPTFFANPDINIPGLMDDMDGFSCSDSEDEDFYDGGSKKNQFDENVAEVEDVGRVRIEFRGRNLAEAIEDEEQAQSRMATLAKNKEEDLNMVSSQPWDLRNIDLNEPDLEKGDLKFEKDWSVIGVNEDFVRQTQSKPISQELSKETEEDRKNSRQIAIPLRLPILNVPSSRWNDKESKDPLSCGVLPRDNDVIPSFSFDKQPNLVETVGPSPSLLLQSLTMSNSNDVINLGKLTAFYFDRPYSNRTEFIFYEQYSNQ